MRNPFTRRNADNTFKAKAVADLEVVTAKLDAARQALAAVEVDIRNASLSAVLSDDPEAIMAPLRERHRRAQEQVELCEAAFEIAQQAQAARVAAAADAAERARVKAIKTNVAALIKVAARGREHLTAFIKDDWPEMQRIVKKIEPALRPQELKQLFGGTPVSEALEILVSMEMFRQAPDMAGLPLIPKAHRKASAYKPHGVYWGDIDPIERQIERRFVAGSLMFLPHIPFHIGDGSGSVEQSRQDDAERRWLEFDALPDTEKAKVKFPPEKPKSLDEKPLKPRPAVSTVAPAPVTAAAFEDDPHIVEMRRVQSLIATAGEPAAPVEPAAPDGGDPELDDLQRRLAVEAAAVGAVEQE